MSRLSKLFIISALLLLIVSCVEKNPPRDEIPLIKNLLGQFEKAVREHNPAGIDSLIIAEAYDEGYHSTKILSDIYGSNNTEDFIKFGVITTGLGCNYYFENSEDLQNKPSHRIWRRF